MGQDLWGAFHRMETVEHTAKIYMNIQMIGNGCELSEKELSKLFTMDEYGTEYHHFEVHGYDIEVKNT